MAIGVSTQSSLLKPCSASSLWFSPLYRRSVLTYSTTSRALSTVFNRVNPYFLRNANSQLIGRLSYCTLGEAERIIFEPQPAVYANLHKKSIDQSNLQRSAWALHGVSLKENLLKEVQLAKQNSEKYESEGKGLLSRSEKQHTIPESKSIKTFDQVINDKPMESWSSTSRIEDHILSEHQKRSESKSPKVFNQDISGGIKESSSSALLSEVYILPKYESEGKGLLSHSEEQHTIPESKSIKTFDQVINDKPMESWSSTSRVEDHILSEHQKWSESKSPKAFNQDISGGIKEFPSSAFQGYILPTEDLRIDNDNSVGIQHKPKVIKSKRKIISSKTARPASQSNLSPSLKPFDESKTQSMEKVGTGIEHVTEMDSLNGKSVTTSENLGGLSRSEGQHTIPESKSIKTFDQVINDKPMESWSSTSSVEDRILSEHQKRSESKSPKAFNQDLRIDNDNSVGIQHKPKATKSKLKSISSKTTRPANQSNLLPFLKPLDESKTQSMKKVGTGIKHVTEMDSLNGKSVTTSENLGGMCTELINSKQKGSVLPLTDREKLSHIYEKVLIVDNIPAAKKIVELLTTKYKDLVHACDTEVAKIDVKRMTPVNHGEVICFSIYSGPEVDFGDGKSCIWVDVLGGGKDNILLEFRPFFEDSSIKKVWHNYSFDSHVIENYGINMSGFHADTMHMARLWDSSRQMDGGYGLEALTGNQNVMNGVGAKEDKKSKMDGKISMNEAKANKDIGEMIGKISMKTIFGKKKLKKDGTDGKLTTIADVEELQTGDGYRMLWICYSALDSISTLRLFESLKEKLIAMDWVLDEVKRGNMFDFYINYWQPFGELLVKMETEGFLVDREYLENMKDVAAMDKKIAEDRFRKWASMHCPDASFMNVGSGTQLRQLFFGGDENSKDELEPPLPSKKTFKVPNDEKIIEEGKKVATKFRNITLHKIGKKMDTKILTATGWPSTSGDALKTLVGKLSSEYCWADDDVYGFESEETDESLSSVIVDKPSESTVDVDSSSYGEAYAAFGGGKEGKDACHAIAALCELSSIDKMLSNFFCPLLSDDISGTNGRIHCSLNINTETGRLSARRPNLQNQPALEKDRYKIRQAFIAAPGNSLVVADYGQLELRILAHLTNCKSMLEAFKAGGDFHSRTAMLMYDHIKEAVNRKDVMLEWHPRPGEEKPPVPLLKDAFASERRKAKMLNFSIAYGKTPIGLARDWKVSQEEAEDTVNLWYKERQEVLKWQDARKKEAREKNLVHTLLGRTRRFPSMTKASYSQKRHIERAAINTPVQMLSKQLEVIIAKLCALASFDGDKRFADAIEDEVEIGEKKIVEKARLDAGVVMEDSKKFYRDGLEMKHHEEMMEREVHRAIDLVGGKDGDVSKSFWLKSDEEVAILMREGSAADVAMCAMLEISKNRRLKELGWRLLLQVHDEVILEGPTESSEEAKNIVVDCMSKPFLGVNFLKVDLSVDAKCAQNWYAAK
ncbi:hypothetical protein GIB67_030125 [Kingdonia uniflora]|uniref:DNA-directed DNA polymerase n=1 Tax=Kingdonia uniflora TaxID=39325 RepID=A0A7J7L2G7_9MAGN|nr:hypothetical protein GIB67_030125 [Kingdonia uniflora]